MDARRYGDGDPREVGLISMKGMAWQKRLFPVVSVVPLVVTVVLLWRTWPANPLLLLAGAVISLVGSILTGFRLFQQVDEVVDAGDHLIVKKDDQEVRIPLKNLTKVSATFWGVTLHLSESVPFGSTITFTPQPALGRGAVVMSLGSRVLAANRH